MKHSNVFNIKDFIRDENLEHKEFQFDIKATAQPDKDGMFRFEAYGSTFGNIDLGDDVIVKGAFTESLTKRTPIILWQHDRFEPIGMPEGIVEDEIGLKLSVVMPADDDFVRGRVMPQLRIGSIKAMSIGFRVIDFHIEDGIRFITKAELREVSLVTFPMNESAVVTAVKSVMDMQDLPFADRAHGWNAVEADKRVRAFTKAEQSPSSSYTKNFMWHDLKTSDEFSSYKLGFVDIVEGERTVIPRALFSIKGALNGSKDALGLPSEAKARINTINDKYIAKLDKEQPIKMLNSEDLKELNKRDLEKALRDSGAFSKDAAVIVASGFQEAGDPPTEDEATIKMASKILGIKSDVGETDIVSESALNKLENMVNQNGGQGT